MGQNRKHRILFDLSPALCGYSGIPQTTRQLFESFARCPEVEVTGLIWGHSNHCLLHQFYTGPLPFKRLGNEAEFLQSLLDHLDPVPTTVWQNNKKNLRAAWRTWSQRCFKVHPLSPTWNDFVWQHYFAAAAAPSSRALLASVPYAATTLTPNYLRSRLKNRLPLSILDTRGYDTLFFQYPLPVSTTPGTRIVFRTQDLVPLLHFYTQPRSTRNVRFLQKSISRTPANGVLVTATRPTEQELLDVYAGIKLNTRTIPHFLPSPVKVSPSTSPLDRILQARVSPDTLATGGWSSSPVSGDRLAREGYLMAVSTLEPRKNWLTLLQAFSILRTRMPVRLVVVGSPGWKFEPILSALRPLVKTREVIHLSNVTRDELATLYFHARALVYPSFQEGFGLPPLEAAQQGTPSVLSDIPVHRAVMEEGALYCDPYDATDIARVLEAVMVDSPEAEALRLALVTKAKARLHLFREETVLKQWLELFRAG